MNADLFERYMRMQEAEEPAAATPPPEEPKKKETLKDKAGKAVDWVKDKAKQVAAPLAMGAAVAGGMLLGANGKEVTPEQLQQQNVQLQQAADSNLKIDVDSLLKKAQQNPTSRYATQIATGLTALSDDGGEAPAQQKIKGEGGGLGGLINGVRGLIGR
jgi:uncharacterized protein HemX